MSFIVGLLALISVVHAAPYHGHFTYPAATTLIRAPEHDSAIVRSNRFGGNFAYSIAQRHAYQVLAPNTVALYNHDPFGYSHHQFNQFPFGASVPGHFYIQHPTFAAAPIVPSFVSLEYPHQQPTVPEYPHEEQTEPIEDGEPTENPDSENVDVVIAGENGDTDANREEVTDENVEENNDTIDDSITVDAYRFSGDN